jgi:hypothetical protein
MNQAYDKSWWESSWRNRMAAVKAAFGPTEPPDQVRTFRFPEPRLIVPGACAIAFRTAASGGVRLHMSLGPSQPLTPTARGNPWEFGVYAPGESNWPSELLYDLVLGYAEHPTWLSEGHCLPLTFFVNQKGELDCGSIKAGADPRIVPVGSLRALYLWPDIQQRKKIDTERGPFFLMIATGITADEERAGDATTPPHVLLFLRDMGIGQTTDPNRRSAFESEGAAPTWSKISSMSQTEVLQRLSS